jgi:hypothetical protein
MSFSRRLEPWKVTSGVHTAAVKIIAFDRDVLTVFGNHCLLQPSLLSLFLSLAAFLSTELVNLSEEPR